MLSLCEARSITTDGIDTAQEINTVNTNPFLDPPTSTTITNQAVNVTQPSCSTEPLQKQVIRGAYRPMREEQAAPKTLANPWGQFLFLQHDLRTLTTNSLKHNVDVNDILSFREAYATGLKIQKQEIGQMWKKWLNEILKWSGANSCSHKIWIL